MQIAGYLLNDTPDGVYQSFICADCAAGTEIEELAYDVVYAYAGLGYTCSCGEEFAGISEAKGIADINEMISQLAGIADSGVFEYDMHRYDHVQALLENVAMFADYLCLKDGE